MATDMNMPSMRRSISSITTVAMSDTQSLTYPLTRVCKNAIRAPPPSPSSSNASMLQTAYASPNELRITDLNHVHSNAHPLAGIWNNIPHFRLPTGNDFDEENDSVDEEHCDPDLDMLALCTMDSIEIIRRDTEEKWKGSRNRSKSESVMSEVKRTAEKIRSSVKNRVKNLVRRFTC